MIAIYFFKQTDVQLKSATGAISINGFRFKKNTMYTSTYLINNPKKNPFCFKTKKGKKIIYCLNVRRNRKLRKFSNPFRCVGAFCMRIVHVLGYQCAHSPSQKKKVFLHTSWATPTLISYTVHSCRFAERFQ